MGDVHFIEKSLFLGLLGIKLGTKIMFKNLKIGSSAKFALTFLTITNHKHKGEVLNKP